MSSSCLTLTLTVVITILHQDCKLQNVFPSHLDCLCSGCLCAIWLFLCQCLHRQSALNITAVPRREAFQFTITRSSLSSVCVTAFSTVDKTKAVHLSYETKPNPPTCMHIVGPLCISFHSADLYSSKIPTTKQKPPFSKPLIKGCLCVAMVRCDKVCCYVNFADKSFTGLPIAYNLISCPKMVLIDREETVMWQERSFCINH